MWLPGHSGPVCEAVHVSYSQGSTWHMFVVGRAVCVSGWRSRMAQCCFPKRIFVWIVRDLSAVIVGAIPKCMGIRGCVILSSTIFGTSPPLKMENGLGSGVDP